MLSKALQKKLFKLVIELGKEAESIKAQTINIKYKYDYSPLTKADTLVNEGLVKFAKSTDFKKIISEENKITPYSVRKDWEYYWLIDPIDGTKEFVNKGSDYTINIALCKGLQPIFSVVYVPARNELFHAALKEGSYKNNKLIFAKKNISAKISVVSSKSHLNVETNKYIEQLRKLYAVELVQFGSSLKICKIAEGKADIYPRFGPTMEWDTCAADLILREAGGFIFDSNHELLKYNKKDLTNPFFIASANRHILL